MKYREVKEQPLIFDLDTLYRDFRDHRPMKYNTSENLRKSIGYLKRFLLQEIGTDNPPLDFFDVRTLIRFTLWFRKNEDGCEMRAISYVKLTVLQIKRIFHYARKMKIIDSYPFEDYDSPLESVVRHAADMLDRKVSKEDLYLLTHTPLPNRKFERTRNLFLFQRWTGMAWVDLNHYGSRIREVVRKDLSQRDVLIYNRVKTGELAIVPIFPETKELLERLEYNVEPGLYNTYYAQIQSLFAQLNLNKEGMGTHTGRHLFGSEMLEMGFTMEAVSRMMGHATVDETQRVYAKINSDKIFADVERIKKIHDVFERKEGLPPVQTVEIPKQETEKQD